MAGVSDDRAMWLARGVLPHEPALRAWLKRRRVAEIDIDDVVQETYARLASLGSVDSIRDARSYAFQTAWSIYVSQVRRASIVAIRTVSNLDQLNAESPEPSPERQLYDRDELERLAIALASLPEKCRGAFLLRRVEGLSQRETADRLGVSEKTVEKHMARGIRLLMDAFGRGGKEAARASSRAKQSSPQYHEPKIVEPGD